MSEYRVTENALVACRIIVETRLSILRQQRQQLDEQLNQLQGLYEELAKCPQVQPGAEEKE